MQEELIDRRRDVWLAVGIWVLTTLVITVLVAAKPADRTLIPLYRSAVEAWSARADLYAGPLGMNYFPQFILAFGPFAALPTPWCDLLWRWVACAALGTGVWRLVQISSTRRKAYTFFWATVLALPLCLGAMRNGQVNALFAAIWLHACVELARGRHRAAAGWIVASVICKPLGLVLLLLSVWRYPQLIRPVVGLTLLSAAVLFVIAPPGYVLEQFAGCVTNLRECSEVVEDRFANLAGIARALSIDFPPAAASVAALIAAVATFAAWIMVSHDLDEPERSLVLLALSAAYLMLFNPMNESNSYVIVAPVMVVMLLTILEANPHHVAARTIAWSVVVIGIGPELVRPLAPNFSLWAKPLTVILFVLLILRHYGRRSDSRQLHWSAPFTQLFLRRLQG